DGLRDRNVTGVQTCALPISMLRETARRTYYLQIDKVIDESQKGAANQYIFNVRKTLNNTLFKDFVMRMANLLEDDETPWRDFNRSEERRVGKGCGCRVWRKG